MTMIISGPRKIGGGFPVHTGIRAGGLGGGIAPGAVNEGLGGVAADLAPVLDMFNYSIRRPTFNEQEDPKLSSAGEVFMIQRGTDLHGAVVLEGEKATVLSLGQPYTRDSLYKCFYQICELPCAKSAGRLGN